MYTTKCATYTRVFRSAGSKNGLQHRSHQCMARHVSNGAVNSSDWTRDFIGYAMLPSDFLLNYFLKPSNQIQAYSCCSRFYWPTKTKQSVKLYFLSVRCRKSFSCPRLVLICPCLVVVFTMSSWCPSYVPGLSLSLNIFLVLSLPRPFKAEGFSKD